MREDSKAPKLNKALEVRELRSTLKDITTYSDRQCGNTTRQVDKAIEIVFNGDICIVRDHNENGINMFSNRLLFKKILRRLSYEHGILSSGLIINKIRLTIQLI